MVGDLDKQEVESLIAYKGQGFDAEFGDTHEGRIDWMGLCESLAAMCSTDEQREYVLDRIGSVLGAQSRSAAASWIYHHHHPGYQ